MSTGRKTPRRVPVQERAQATVDAILDATEQLARERGIEELAIRAIADRAGVSPGTLYQYFGSLEAVLAAWEERSLAADVERYVAGVGEVLSSPKTPEEKIGILASDGFDMITNRMSYYRDRTHAELVSRITTRLELARRFAEGVARALDGSRARSRLRRQDSHAAARLAIVTVHFAAYDAWHHADTEEARLRIRAEVAAMITAYLLRDLAPGEDPYGGASDEPANLPPRGAS